MRDNLVQNYLACQYKFEGKYSDKVRKHPQQYHIGNSLGFHGTSSSSLSNIGNFSFRASLKNTSTNVPVLFTKV